mgnify:CR=1 FL=1
MRPPYRVNVFLEALEFVGYKSLMIVGMMGLFIGMVFALQLVSTMRTFQTKSFVGSTIALALTQELAPVFTTIMVTARTGTGMAIAACCWLSVQNSVSEDVWGVRIESIVFGWAPAWPNGTTIAATQTSKLKRILWSPDSPSRRPGRGVQWYE